MLVVETVAKIRRAYFVQGKPIKAICRELRLSRKVVRKVLRSEATEFRYERGIQPLPRLGPWRDALDELLGTNAAKPGRERLTLIRLFEELRGRGYEGGYDAVRRYAREWQRNRVSVSAGAYVPLSFAPGEAYQFDWSHEVVVLGGATVTVKVAHVRLCHSRMPFVRAYPRETQEMVFDAHDRAFAFFRGACARGIYDNMKTAVDAIFVGRERAYNRRFLQMCSHYLVDPVACTPASGWEKGQVENQVGLVRERFFTPRLRMKNYEEMNAWLLDQCVAHAKAHHHPEQRDRTIWEMFEAERPSLVRYSGRFDGFHAVPVSVSKTCLVRFDNNKYFVTASAVSTPEEKCIGGPEQNYITDDGSQVPRERDRRLPRLQQPARQLALQGLERISLDRCAVHGDAGALRLQHLKRLDAQVAVTAARVSRRRAIQPGHIRVVRPNCERLGRVTPSDLLDMDHRATLNTRLAGTGQANTPSVKQVRLSTDSHLWGLSCDYLSLFDSARLRSVA